MECISVVVYMFWAIVHYYSKFTLQFLNKNRFFFPAFLPFIYTRKAFWRPKNTN